MHPAKSNIYFAKSAGRFSRLFFLDSFVALETAKRKLGLGISIFVWVSTRWTRTLLALRRITENPDHNSLSGHRERNNGIF